MIRLFCSLLVLAFFGCKNNPDTLPPFYNVEEPESFEDKGEPNTAVTKDNEIYKPGRVFTFQYTYTSQTGDALLIGVDAESEAFGKGSIPWRMVQQEDAEISDYPVQEVNLIIYATTTPMENFLSGQTIIKYEFYNDAGEVGFGELTGLIEDSAKVWLHPPRALGFVILEFNPFPEILKPLGKDTSWNRQIYIPEEWSKELGLEIDGTTSMTINYKTNGREQIQTTLGKLNCYKVIAESIGEPGRTTATFYFDKQFGFVRMKYDNIDGSTLQFDLGTVKK